MTIISFNMTALGMSTFIPSILPFLKTIFEIPSVDLSLETAVLF